ncbi:MAG: hypothetical protein Kow0013_14530 [Pararhodobacter sp.]
MARRIARHPLPIAPRSVLAPIPPCAPGPAFGLWLDLTAMPEDGEAFSSEARHAAQARDGLPGVDCHMRRAGSPRGRCGAA